MTKFLRYESLLAVFTLISATCTAVHAQQAEFIYVDIDAPPGGSGGSWFSSYHYLQDALNDPFLDNGTTIKIADGTYFPDESSEHPDGTSLRDVPFALPPGVILEGGYGGISENEPDERDLDTYVTILSGDLNDDDGPNFTNYSDNSFHVCRSENGGEGLEINGVIIRGGNSNGPPPGASQTTGGGIIYDTFGGAGTIVNCTITENRADAYGGGIAVEKFTLLEIRNCVICENEGSGLFGVQKYATGGGGVSGWDLDLINCKFNGNSAPGENHGLGGGIVADSIDAVNCEFIENTATEFGGGVFTSSVSYFDNCLFNGNVVSEGNGGGAYVNSVGESSNNTFTANHAENGLVGGLYVAGTLTDPPRLVNTILYHNTSISQHFQWCT